MNCRRKRACDRPDNHPGPCGYAGGYASPRSKKRKLVPFEDQTPDSEKAATSSSPDTGTDRLRDAVLRLAERYEKRSATPGSTAEGQPRTDH